MNTIKYYSKDTYGKTLYYAIDKIQAKLYTTITGDKTLTENKIEALKMLGVGFEQVVQPKK